jgi:hypothetical protein
LLLGSIAGPKGCKMAIINVFFGMDMHYSSSRYTSALACVLFEVFDVMLHFEVSFENYIYFMVLSLNTCPMTGVLVHCANCMIYLK